MKKWILILSLILCFSFTLFAQDLLTPLNSGNPLGYGAGEESVVMQNLHGDLFLISIKEGELIIQKSSDNGQSFAPYTLSLPGGNFSKVRQLTLYERSYRDWLTFFIAEEKGIDGIYAVGFDESGNLVPAFEDSLDDDYDHGEISRYDVHPDRRSGFFITYLKSRRLCYRFIDEINEPQAAVVISSWEEEVADFVFKERMVGDTIKHYGVYTVIGESEAKLIYFEIENDSLFSSYEILSMPLAEMGAYRVFKDRKGVTYLLYERAGNLYGKLFREGVWSDLQWGSPLNGDKGGVSSFEAFLIMKSGLMVRMRRPEKIFPSISVGSRHLRLGYASLD